MEDGFVCINCGKWVKFAALGTKHRNHCPYCLWSVHVDQFPGDREARCSGKMKPLGLAFKNEGGKKQGELEVVHLCERCGVISKNRLAGDDDVNSAVSLFKQSLEMDKGGFDVPSGIKLLELSDSREIMTQLFGKPKVEEKLKEWSLLPS